jgi:hypothetical protein
VGGGYILLISRARATVTATLRIELEKMPPEVAALLLPRRAGILPLNVPLEAAKVDERVVALEISLAKDGLPLALDQA